MTKSIFYIALVAAMTFSLAACSSNRVATQKEKASTTVKISANATDSQVVEYIVTNEKSWQNVQLSSKINLSSPMQLGVSARVTMVKEQSIDFSVRMLGFEVGYMLIDADSLHVYVKPNKKYVSESLERVFGSDSFTLANLQDLLLGRLFMPGKNTLTTSDAASFSYDDLSDMLIVTPSKQPSGAEIGFVIDRALAQLCSSALTAGTHEGIVNYSGFTTTAAGPMAQNIALNVDNGKIAANMSWDFAGAKWNVKNLTPRKWNTPAGAAKISLNASMLSNLLGGR